jgi:hypothetical protein
MPEAEIGKAVQLLDLMLEHFAEHILDIVSFAQILAASADGDNLLFRATEVAAVSNKLQDLSRGSGELHAAHHLIFCWKS